MEHPSLGCGKDTVLYNVKYSTHKVLILTTQIVTCYYSLQLQLFFLVNYLAYLLEFSFLPHL